MYNDGGSAVWVIMFTNDGASSTCMSRNIHFHFLFLHAGNVLICLQRTCASVDRIFLSFLGKIIAFGRGAEFLM